MSASTKLAQALLTSDYAGQIYESISPIYGESPTGLWLIQAIGEQLDKFRAMIGEYIFQVTPETATWSLPYWEEAYGVVPNAEMTLEQRRKMVLNKMLYRAPMNPAKVEQIISNATGAKVTVVENVSKNKFAIVFSEDKGENILRIKKIVDELKPAHLIYDLSFALIINCIISYYNGLKLRSDFYPRYNVARLWLDGGWDLDGQYRLDGYLLGHYLDFYPSNLAIRMDLMTSTNASNGLAVASGYPVSVEASSGTDFRCGMLQEMAMANQATIAIGATVINGIGSSLVVEKDLWCLDGNESLDGLWQDGNGYRYLEAETLVYDNL